MVWVRKVTSRRIPMVASGTSRGLPLWGAGLLLLLSGCPRDTQAPDAPRLTGTDPASPSSVDQVRILGTAEGGATITLYTDIGCTQSFGAEGKAEGDGTFAVPVAVPADATTTFYATATDAAGNTSGCSTDSVTYVEDSTPPGVPTGVTLTPASPSREPQPRIRGTAETGSTIRVFTDVACGTSAAATGTAEDFASAGIQVTAAANASTTFRVTATDAVGNTSPCPGTGVTYTHDTVPPDPPVLTSVTPAPPSLNPTPTLGGTSEPGAHVRLFGTPDCSGPPLGEGEAGVDGTFALPVAAPADATTTFHATAEDGAGNLSACSPSSVDYTHDDTAPAAPVLTGTAPASPSATVTNPVVLGTAEVGTTVTLYATTNCTGGVQGTAELSAATTFSITATVPANTPTSFTAQARDAAGNVSLCSNAVTFAHDNQRPDPPAFLGTSPASPSATVVRPQVVGTAEVGSTVTLYTTVTCQGASAGAGESNASGSFSILVDTLPNSTTTFFGTATDRAGNVSECSPTGINYTHDSLPPAAPEFLAAGPTTPPSPSRTVTAPLLNGTAEVLATVQVHASANCSGAVVGTATADAVGRFSVAVQVDPNTTTTFSARALDAVGNGSPCGDRPITYTHDNVAPSPPLLTGTNPASPHGENTAPAILGTAEPGAAVLIFDSNTCTGESVAEGTADDQGLFSVTVVVTVNSTTTFYAVTADLAGNRSDCTLQGVTYQHDNTPPLMPLLTGSIPAGQSRTETNPVVTGMAEPRSAVSIYRTNDCLGSPSGTGLASETGSFSIATLATPNDVSRFRATSADAVGNVSACSTSSVDYRHDNTAPPAVRFTGSTPASPSNTSTTPTLRGETEAGALVLLYSDSTCSEGGFAGTGTADEAGLFQVPVTVRRNDTTAFWGTAQDALGNITTCSAASFLYTHDDVDPDAPVLTGLAPASPSNATTSPHVLGTSDPLARVTIYLEEGCTGVPAGEGYATQQGAFDVAATVPPNQESTLYGKARDAAGNSSPCTATGLVFRHDNIKPSPPTFTGTTPASPSNTNRTPTVRGTAEPDATVRVFLSGDCSGAPEATATVASNGSFTTAPITVPANRESEFHGITEDQAGNASDCNPVQTSVRYIHDTAGPSIPTDGYTATVISDVAARLDWRAASDNFTSQANIVYELCRSTTRLVDGGCTPFTATYTTIPGATTELADGLTANLRYYFVLRAKDQAGNVSTNVLEVTAKTGGGRAMLSVSAGDGHTCAVATDGTTVCFGKNSNGQLGNGETAAIQHTPVTVSTPAGNPATQVAAGGSHTCAIMADRTVRCWGLNAAGQLGTGNTTESHTPVAVSGLSNVVALSAGTAHTCAVTVDGKVVCWGSDALGQLGDGLPLANQNLPVEAWGGSPAAVAVAAGVAHTCAVLVDGTGRCWGTDQGEQLGDGEGRVNQPAPVPVTALVSAVEVVAGDKHTCARLASGVVTCWGENTSGQTGDGDAYVGNFKFTPTPIPAFKATRLAGGQNHNCATLSSGEVSCWGHNGRGQAGDFPANGLLNTPTLVSATFLPVLGLAAGDLHSCAIKGDGTAWCWGANSSGQLGNMTTTDTHEPAQVRGILALAGGTAVGAGYYSGCARVADGTARCWGENSKGQVGDGTTQERNAPTTVVGLTNVVMVTSGGDHACAVKADGTAWCWGYNTKGQLGNNTWGPTAGSTTPVQVTGLTDAVSVAVGLVHSCALRATGDVVCWGEGGNNIGKLGHGDFGDYASPVAVLDLANARALGAGENHTCAVVADGTVRCWGLNDQGQLGDGTSGSGNNRSTPVAATGVTGAVAVSGGGQHTCALLASGRARCWGANVRGQLGDGTQTFSSSAVDVLDAGGAPTTGLTSITAGGLFTCALGSNGGARCWGSNSAGQLGDGSTTNRPNPGAVVGLTRAVSLDAGRNYACAMLADGTGACWGDNAFSQLASGVGGGTSTLPSPMASFP